MIRLGLRTTRTRARRVLLALVALVCSACAAPVHRTARPVDPTEGTRSERAVVTPGRPTIGVAFGGGSARGISHVGVIKWLEENRIPIDVAAGTSMGGLVGGAFATGMDARELETFIRSLDWDQLFGASTFAYKNIRRKADAPAIRPVSVRAEGRHRAPAALNNGSK